MLSYAVDDVRYLLPLADRLVAGLREKGREDWFHQSCRSLQDDVAARDNAPREDPWRVNGCGRLHPKGLALLKGMWDWREGIAQERDLPCFKIMSLPVSRGWLKRATKTLPSASCAPPFPGMR